MYHYQLIFPCPEAHTAFIIGSAILMVSLLISLVVFAIAIKIPRVVSLSLPAEQTQYSILSQAQVIAKQTWDESLEKDEKCYIKM